MRRVVECAAIYAVTAMDILEEIIFSLRNLQSHITGKSDVVCGMTVAVRAARWKCDVCLRNRAVKPTKAHRGERTET